MGLTAVGVAAANPFSQPALPPVLLAHARETAVSAPVHAVSAVPEGAPRVAIIPSQLQVVTYQSTPPKDEAAPAARPFGGGRDFEQPFFDDLVAEGELLLQAARPRPLHTDGLPQGGGSGGSRDAANVPLGPGNLSPTSGSAGHGDYGIDSLSQQPGSFGPPLFMPPQTLTPATNSASVSAPGSVAGKAVGIANLTGGTLANGPALGTHRKHDSPPRDGPIVTGGGMTLSILDMENGLALPNNVPVNDFSTYNVELDADVTGATVGTYTWDTSHASDAQNVSGASTYRLTFNWLSFTATTPRTDTITFTATSGANQVSETVTFLVAGTNSPGYTATQPTSPSTWSSLLPPDAVTDQQAMGGSGPYYQVGLTDGELQTTHTLPAYNPNVPALQMIYVSTAANAQPFFVAHYQLPPGVTVPGTITGQLRFNGTTGSKYTWDSSKANAGDLAHLSIQTNATSLATGRYSYTFNVMDSNANPVTTTYSGSADILNYKSNALGAGWNLAGLERIYSVTGGVILDLGDGQSLWFASAGGGNFTTPAGDFSTLTQDSVTQAYTRAMFDGTNIKFNSSGYQTSVADRNNNTTNYNYNGSNQLTSIVDLNSQRVTLAYSGSNVTSITDPANRIATLAYSGSQLTSIKDADGSLWTYAYDTSNDLTKLTNPLNNVTTFTYSSTRISLITRPDAATDQFNPVQVQGQGGAGPGNAIFPPVQDSGSIAGVNTDPRGNIWNTYIDWLGFGQSTEPIDPLNDTGLIHRDKNGLSWMPADGNGNRNREFFDSNGNVTKNVQPDDTTWQYTYNSDSEVSQTTDPRGNLSTASYDTHGNRTQFKDPLGDLSTYTYTSQGFLSTSTDPLNHTTTYSLDSLNRVTTVQDALGNLSTTLYDSASNATTTIDQRGDRTTYSFDKLGRQTQVQDALGNFATTLYDAVGNATQTIDQRGDRTTFSFDKLNRQTQVKDALGNLSTTLYDAAGNVTTRIDARGDRTTYSFDGANRQTQVQDALGNLSTSVYDAAGNLITSLDPLNHRTTYGFDQLNRQTQVQDALGNLSNTIYDAAGNVTTTIDALGRRTSTSYDQLNRQTQVQDPAGNLSTTLYDQAGNVTTTIDARGNRTTTAFDQLNRQTSVTDPLSHTLTTVYDQAGNVTQSIDGAGYTTTYAYDQLNRQTSVQDPAGDITATVFDQAGNVTNTIDPLTHKTTYAFDKDNRQTTVTDPRGGVTTTVYDAAGNVTNIIDPVGNKTTFAFDGLNRQTQMIDPLGHGSTMAFDPAGRLTSQTDRNSNVINYSYDFVNRETGETWLVSSSTVNTFTFTYDAINRLSAANNAGTYTFSYDALNRVTVTQEPFGLTLTATYDQVGNRTLLKDSLNGVLTSIYDQANRLTSRQFGGTSQTPLRMDLTYTPRNQIATETRYSNLAGTTVVSSTTYTYDPATRLTSLQHRNSGGSLLANYTYTYDQSSRLTAEQLNGTSTNYGYDNANELTSAGSNSYGYDLNGNRNTTGYTIGTGNQMLNDPSWTYSYDSEGNMTKKTKGTNAETWYFAYDNRNHLTSAKQESSDGGTVEMQATYVYDALGNRVEKDVGVTVGNVTTVTTTRFAYDGPNVWADLDGNSQLQTRRLYLDTVDSVFARISSGGTAAWYLPDRLGSVRDITDNTGAVIDHIDYDGFGNVTNETQSGNGDRYKWTGREFDSETGLQYNRARYYLPGAGRWTTQDPIAFRAGDSNLYRYVNNGPTNDVDPSGLSVDVWFYYYLPKKPPEHVEVTRINGHFGVKAFAVLDGQWYGSAVAELWLEDSEKKALPPGKYEIIETYKVGAGRTRWGIAWANWTVHETDTKDTVVAASVGAGPGVPSGEKTIATIWNIEENCGYYARRVAWLNLGVEAYAGGRKLDKVFADGEATLVKLIKPPQKNGR
jgi:RHS repeat-associated protein